MYVSVSKIAYGRQALFFHFNLPMDQNAHGRVEDNDGSKHQKLTPLTHDHRAQHLAAELEAQGERDTLRHGQPRVRLLFAKPYNALYTGDKENNRSRSFQ